MQEVARQKNKDPVNYAQKTACKRLKAIYRLAFDIIPQNPADPKYRQGGTLGGGHKHWFRAKFFQQYRLFFRFDSAAKTIVFVWVNDEKTKRAYDSQNDAYKTFEKMLNNGHPPNSWDELLEDAKTGPSRLNDIFKDPL